MRALEKTLAILASVFLLVQTVRHGYVLWFEPRASVLDKYDRPLTEEIASSSLKELDQRFEKVHSDADRARAERRAADPNGNHFDDQSAEPFKSELALRQAISSWEDRAKEIDGLRFYCVAAAVFVGLGVGCYLRLNRWLGLILLIVGFSEAIYWTSPSFFVVGAATREFDRLLVNKLAFSLASVFVLAMAVRAMGVFHDREAKV